MPSIELKHQTSFPGTEEKLALWLLLIFSPFQVSAATSLLSGYHRRPRLRSVILIVYSQEIKKVNAMSHIVTIQTRLHDPAAVTAACTRLGLAAPVQGTARLFSGEATGLLVQLPDWQYPAVIDTLTGTVRYDNYNGQWGDQKHLGRLLQMYSVEKTKIEARKRGYSVSEQALQDGSIQVRVLEGF
jgi:hypothetical protein